MVRGGGVGREVPGKVVGDVSWVKHQFATSGVVKVECRDGCVDVWIIQVVVWGVVIGWGTDQLRDQAGNREMSISVCW